MPGAAEWLLILCTVANCQAQEKVAPQLRMERVTEKQCNAMVSNWNRFYAYTYCIGPDGEYYTKPWLLKPERK